MLLSRLQHFALLSKAYNTYALPCVSLLSFTPTSSARFCGYRPNSSRHSRFDQGDLSITNREITSSMTNLTTCNSPSKKRLCYSRTDQLDSNCCAENECPVVKSRVICCPKCHGEGKVRSKKSRTKKQKQAYLQAKDQGLPLPQLQQIIRMESCQNCAGTGVIPYDHDSIKDDDGCCLPRVKQGTHIGIIGGGIGGMALALACQHRNIPFTVYERDESFHQRSQGYGLTMQQGGKALQALGLETTGSQRLYGKGIHSKRHIVHLPDGSRVGEWGMKVWGRPETKKEEAKRQNVHIARQELRRLIYDQIEEKERILWGYKLVSYKEENDGVSMCFSKKGSNENEEETVIHSVSCVVGADGIRSAVRRQKIGDNLSPLRYLGCIVILGIAPSPQSSDLTSDNESVFQTADGTTRLYAMPFSKKGNETANASAYIQAGEGNGETMWQLSFPMDENEAIELSSKGAPALKKEALRRCGKWHVPIPDLLQNSPEELISGYPVYDRELLDDAIFRSGTKESSNGDSHVTLLGDAAHPMSPFKGQGANQALLDAVLLARALYKVFQCKSREEEYILGNVLTEYESSMLNRSTSKVKASADAAKFLHTKAAISEGNITRGAAAASLENGSS